MHKIDNVIASRDVQQLNAIAVKHGLAKHRRLAWPILLKLNNRQSTPTVEEYGERHQVTLDVNRSLTHLSISADSVQSKRKELQELLDSFFLANPEFHYYQGFHDIASILLLTVAPEQAKQALEHMSFYFLRDFLRPSIDPVLRQLKLIMFLLKTHDEELYAFLIKNGTESYFSLPWVLTWFAHDLNDLPVIQRLWDVFLATHPFMVCYVAVAVVLQKRNVILKNSSDEVHEKLASLKGIDFDKAIDAALKLDVSYPVDWLQRKAGLWLGINSVVNRFDHDWTKSKEGDIVLAKRLLLRDLHGRSLTPTNGLAILSATVLVVGVGVYYLKHTQE